MLVEIRLRFKFEFAALIKGEAAVIPVNLTYSWRHLSLFNSFSQRNPCMMIFKVFAVEFGCPWNYFQNQITAE